METSTAPASISDPVVRFTAPEATSPNYVIGPEDSLQINVWKEPGVSAGLPVRPDGKISLPLVGDIQAAGFTPMQLAQVIALRLKGFIKDPTVTVTVMGVNSKRVYMIGEIGRVGPLTISPGMTILQAIATAGGVSQYANSRKIYILRGVPGKQQKILFDYKKALKNGDMQGITLIPGDTIVFP